MKTESFNAHDIKALKAVIKQKMVSYLFVLMILIILVTVSLGLINESINLLTDNEKIVISMSLISASSLGYLGFIYKSIRINIIEIKDVIKEIIIGRIARKANDTNYAWTMNPIYDAICQPKVEEGFFEIDGRRFAINDSNYKRFEVGDYIRIARSPKTKLILEVEGVA